MHLLVPLGLSTGVAGVTYLTLCLVFLCWSSNDVDLGWWQSQDIVHRDVLHGTVCSTDFDVALKQISLLKWTPYWTLCSTRMALVLQWSSKWVHCSQPHAANHRKLRLSACAAARTTGTQTGRTSGSLTYSSCQEAPLDVLSAFLAFSKVRKEVMAKAIYCSKGREFSNFTEWHSLEKRFQATNRFLVPLAWDSGGKWSSVAVGRAPVHLRRRSSLGGSCVETTMKPHAVFAYRDGQ